jgi:poly(3-hydroxybutyrate) depolymerase
MRNHLIFGITMCMVSIANAQSIKVSGTVKDATDKPIANATVELLRAKAKDTTGADGAYSIDFTPNAVQRSAVPMSSKMSLQKGILELATAHADLIQVEIFDVQGNRMDRLIMEMASAGTYRLNLAGKVRSHNLVIVKASVGRTTKSFPYLPTGLEAAPSDFSPGFSARTGASLAKVSAAVDTLQVSASGFATKKVELISAEATVDVTLETSADIWGGLKNPPGKSAGCGKPAAITNGRKSITSGGRQREYIIDIPADYDPAKAYRLFYCSHGYGENMDKVVGKNYYGLKPLAIAAKEPAVFISVQGLNNTWGEVDHAFFDDVATFAKNGLCIDTTRVFATGMSMGGMYSYSLSTTRQKRIRAAVGLAPTNFVIWLPAVKLKDPIAWMHTTGMSDGTCAWVANEAQRTGSKFIALEKAADNGCTIPANIPTWTSGNHICYDFAGCKPGYPVKACTWNGGHDDNAKDPGSNVNWIPVESWKFFTQF